MLRLASKTEPGWAAVALADVPTLLCDHAHCEKKAAASALSLLTTYPHQAALAQPLARLAQEETRHFFTVLAELSRRQRVLARDRGDPYAAALMSAAAGSGPQRLRDRLLIGALIEARSCERFGLLAAAAPAIGEDRLARLYGRLLQAEARHHQLFVDLAAALFGEADVRRRLDELSFFEAEVCQQLPRRAAIH